MESALNFFLKNGPQINKAWGKLFRWWQNKTQQSDHNDEQGSSDNNDIWGNYNLMRGISVNEAKELNLLQLKAMELTMKMKLINLPTINGKIDVEQ